MRNQLFGLGLMCLCLGACGMPDYNGAALQIGAEPPAGGNVRAFETMRLMPPSDAVLMAAITTTMQDLGFTVTETSSEIGVVAAQKSRDARETREIVGAVASSVIEQILTGMHHDPVYNKSQVIHVTVVASPVGSARDVRVTFDRYLIDNNENLRATDIVSDPKIYSQFFAQLATNLRQAGRS